MVKDLYLMDNNKYLIKIINTNHDDIVVYDDVYSPDLSTGAETYTATFKVSYEEQPLLLEGNYIGFYWQDKFKLMQIKRTESQEHIDDIHITIHAEFIGIELYNSYVENLVSDGNVTKILTDILKDTNYKVGYVSPTLDAQDFRVEVTEITSVYALLQNLTPTFNECEWEFGVEVIDSIAGQYEFTVNCYANGERGVKRYDRFEPGKNSYGMKREGDITNFCSGIIPIGKNGLTITNTKWETSQGDPLDKPLGQNYLFDPEAHALLNNGGKYILMKYKSDAEDQYSLMWDAYYKLLELNKTKFSYEIPVYMTEEKYETIGIGDTNYVVNNKFNPPIMLEARISKFEISFTDRSKNKITLANFKEVQSRIKSLTKQDIVNSVVGQITGKLTESDVVAIRKYLEQLGVDKNTIDKLIDKYKDKIVPDTVAPKDEEEDFTVTPDQENYRAIKLSKIDNGLWIGDDRIYDVKRAKSAEIETKETIKTTTNTEATVSAPTSAEYKEALNYYKKFSLGTLANNTCMSKLKSKSNPYKIYVAVEYWSKKFGVDPQLVYAIIYAESSANPYDATKYSGGGYGLMQCEREAYFNKTQTVKFLDGSTKKFTPSYSNMRPGSCGKITLNGITIDKAISNQIMFGCHELRVSLRRFKWNIFAALMGYNFGLYGADLVICRYVAMKNGLSWVNRYGYKAQSSKVQALYFKELEKPTAAWAGGRKWYQQNHAGTWWYIEGVLRWYKIVDGQLPYVIDDNGNKKGYGAGKTTTPVKTPTTNPKKPSDNTTTKPGVATDIRKKICAKAKEITELHQKYKKATYNGSYAIYDDSKRYRAPITWKGIYRPYCYVCSSLTSCAYKYAGLSSIVGWQHANCSGGTLVRGATAKSGYLMEKLTSSTIDHLLPGDLLMISNGTVPSNLTVSWAAAPNGANRYDKGTHHVIVYMGKVNGVRMIAHASGNKLWPKAIRYEKMFDCYTSNFWYKHAFILRPWDLAKADREAKKTDQSTTNKPKEEEAPTETVTTTEVTLIGLPGATPGDFIQDGKLFSDVAINNVENTTDFPSTCSYVFCHFGINDLSEEGIKNYQSLLKLLLNKYPKKPIFIAKEPKVTSKYGSNYQTVNEQIQNFNEKMEDFANRTRYVIMVRKPTPLVDESNDAIWDPSYTNDSWTFKDTASRDKYYAAYKSKILSLSYGGATTRTNTTASPCLLTETVYHYTKPMKSISFTLPKHTNDSYYSRLIFTTSKNSKPTKYKQSSEVYLQGTHCKKGQLIPKADTTYSIVIYYNPDTDISNKKYLGSVSAVSKGGKYTSFTKFKYQDDLVSYAKSFVDKNENFIYNNTTPLDFSNPADNIDKWKTNDKFHIDDSAFLSYVLMGWKYSTSNYGKPTKTNRNSNSKVNWALPSTRSEANIAKYFVQEGWILDGADLDNFTNINPGDILFMDSDSINNNNFMGISHTAIVKGKDNSGNVVAYECVNNLPSGVFKTVKLKDLSKKNILFVGRIAIYGKEEKEEKQGIKAFPYANDLVAIAKTYLDNANNEYTNGNSWSQGTTYRASNTPLSSKCVADMDVTNSFWVKKGTKHYKAIDCSTLVGMALRGYTYQNGPYGSEANFTAFRKNIKQTNKSVTWAFAVPRTAAEIGEYCKKKGWVVPLKDIGNAKNNYEGIKKGDLIFWAKKDDNGKYKEPERFMKISHVAIVYGKSSDFDNRLCVIESTNNTTKVHNLSDGTKINCGVRIKDLANNKPDEIVMVARIQV